MQQHFEMLQQQPPSPDSNYPNLQDDDGYLQLTTPAQETGPGEYLELEAVTLANSQVQWHFAIKRQQQPPNTDYDYQNVQGAAFPDDYDYLEPTTPTQESIPREYIELGAATLANSQMQVHAIKRQWLPEIPARKSAPAEYLELEATTLAPKTELPSYQEDLLTDRGTTKCLKISLTIMSSMLLLSLSANIVIFVSSGMLSVGKFIYMLVIFLSSSTEKEGW